MLFTETILDKGGKTTVISLCVHSDGEVTMGLIINCPLDFALGEVLSQMDLEPCDDQIKDIPFYQGRQKISLTNKQTQLAGIP